VILILVEGEKAQPGAPEPQTSRAILEHVANHPPRRHIVAWKGLGGYQLACDARQPAAVEELRRRKHRSEKPFAIMVADEAVAESLCFVSSRRARRPHQPRAPHRAAAPPA
jgi:hydrogenase maturation factor HypF (carbamoyltransferase family)